MYLDKYYMSKYIVKAMYLEKLERLII